MKIDEGVPYLKINVFEGQNRAELSMIEVAHALLEQKNEEMYFNDLVNAIQEYLGKADTEIKETLSRFYTDLNIDGSFISLGDNKWGLRSWYAIDEIDEAVTHLEEDDEEETVKRKKRNGKVNAFINSPDDDVINYNDDDPEDDGEFNDDDDDISDKAIDDDDDEEIVAYDNDLKEIVVDADEEEVDIDEEDEDDDDLDDLDEDEDDEN